MTTVEHDKTLADIKEELLWYFSGAANFRVNLIPKDKPWNPKNETYAARLNRVLAYIKTLPDDHHTLAKLATCRNLINSEAGFQVPDDDWIDVIHIVCGSTAEEVAEWFEAWVDDLLEGEAVDARHVDED